MKLLKPLWVNHEDNPIYSVDIHPDNSRFATGGMCGDAGRVCIWNMGPVYDEEQEKNECVHKMLCRMDNHLSCVNCVRWSRTGRYLASGADDRIIFIWQHSGQGGSSFGGVTNVEQWRSVATLRGHAMEVLDVAWSPDDSLLASASPDNTIIIWSGERLGEIVTTLRGHTGLVKGVTWDPIGKYLASQADDKSLRIWRTSDWKEEEKITEPFSECGGTTHVLRLGWSPDGQFLVSAHAMNNLGSTAQIIERDTWNSDKDFVGHRKAVTCVRFNDRIFSKKVLAEKKVRNGQVNGHTMATEFCPKKSSSKSVCVAMGSRDRTLSVWTTSLKRPLLVMHDMFKNTIVDLSWSSDGMSLMACSMDGTIAYLQFTETELGQPISEEEKSIQFEKLYGKTSFLDNKSTKSPIIDLIEDPELLKVHEEEEAKQLDSHHVVVNGKKNNNSGLSSTRDCENQKSQMSSGSGSSRSPTSKNPTDRQIETKMPDGRRRITPLFIPPSEGTNGVPKPYTSKEENIMSSSSAAKSKIMVEHVDLSNDKFSNSSPSKSAAPDAPALDAESSLKIPAAIISRAVNNNKEEATDSPAKADNNSKKSGGESLTSSKRKLEKPEPPPPSISRKRPAKQTTSASSINKHGPAEAKAKTSTPPEPITVFTSSSSSSSVLLPSLVIEKSALVRISEIRKNIYAENSASSTPLSILKLTSGSSSTSSVDDWKVVLSSRIRSVSGGKDMVACTCEDLTVHLFDTEKGSRLHPPFMIDSHASKVIISGHRLLIISSHGKLWLWDFNPTTTTSISSSKSIVRGDCLRTLFALSKDCYISSCSIASKGFPIISFSNGKSFMYDVPLGTFTLLLDEGDALASLFQSKYAAQSSSSADGHGHLTKGTDSLASLKALHWKSNSYAHNRSLKGVLAANDEMWQEAAISYCDRQIASAQRLHSSAEFRFWTLELIKLFVTFGSELRLRSLLDSLLPPSRLNRRKSDLQVQQETDQQLICGVSKLEVLNKALSLMSKNVQLQRTYSEYKDMLAFSLSYNSIGGASKSKTIDNNSNNVMPPSVTKKNSIESNNNSHVPMETCQTSIENVKEVELSQYNGATILKEENSSVVFGPTTTTTTTDNNCSMMDISAPDTV